MGGCTHHFRPYKKDMSRGHDLQVDVESEARLAKKKLELLESIRPGDGVSTFTGAVPYKVLCEQCRFTVQPHNPRLLTMKQEEKREVPAHTVSLSAIPGFDNAPNRPFIESQLQERVEALKQKFKLPAQPHQQQSKKEDVHAGDEKSVRPTEKLRSAPAAPAPAARMVLPKQAEMKQQSMRYSETKEVKVDDE